jgi:uncharacterized membrane protein (TIGR02234 family)
MSETPAGGNDGNKEHDDDMPDIDNLQGAPVQAKKARSPWWQRKSTLILLAIAAALAVFGTTTQTWIHVNLVQGQVQQANLNIAGSKAAVSVSALALVALAGSLASTIAGKIARIITGVLMALSAIGIVAAALTVLVDPSNAAAGPVGAATGVVGQPSDASITVFPLIAVIAAVVLGVTAIMIIWFGRGWTQRSKYDTAPAGPGTPVDDSAPLDEIDSWDRLTRGDDPTT